MGIGKLQHATTKVWVTFRSEAAILGGVDFAFGYTIKPRDEN